MRVTFSPYYRKRGKNEKHGTVYIRVTVQRKHIYCPTFIYLEDKEWNAAKKRVKPSATNSEENNAVIIQVLAETQKKYLDWRLNGKPVNYAELDKLYHAKTTATNCYLKDVVFEYITLNQFSDNRERHYKSFVNMAVSLGLPKNLANATTDHAVKFLAKLRSSGYSPNTITGYIKRAKTIFSFAVKKGYLKTSPMDELKTGKWETNRKFIDEFDIQRIERTLPDLTDDLQNIAKKFLFSCYTGLRYSELPNVKAANIIVNDDGPALNLWQSKTKTQKLLPLLPQAIKLLNVIDWQQCSNHHYNSCLKRIAKAANIDKNLTSHVGRHTFATIGLNKGIRMEVMQDYLGHGDIKTTQGYAHLTTATLAKEIQVWNK